MESTRALLYLIAWLFPIAIAMGLVTCVGCVAYYVCGLARGDTSPEPLIFGIATGLAAMLLTVFIFIS